MISFDAYDLIALWEKESALSSAQRGLLLLALANPQQSRQALGAMTVGQRDRILLDMRRQLFGDQVEGIVHCSRCDETLELCVNISDFLAVSAESSARTSLRVGEYDITFRLPTVDDALSVERHRERHDARRSLLQGCILSANRGDASVDPQEIDDITLARIAQCMEELDPLAEIQLSITCADCEHSESILLDIASYLWAELITEAERLLDEVRLLASQYGWREMDIVAMTGRRRQFYLDRRAT